MSVLILKCQIFLKYPLYKDMHIYLLYIYIFYGDRGGTVVKVLCYKSEGRWFDPSWCHWNFSLT